MPRHLHRGLLDSGAMLRKTVMVAHRDASVRERFAAALDTAGHRVVCVAHRAALDDALAHEGADVALALVDATLWDGAPSGALPAPVVLFAGSVAGAAEARAWAAAGVRGWVNEFSAPHTILASLAPLLFRDSFDRRSSPRVPVGIAVSCTAGETVTAATVLNIGTGGLSLRPLVPIAPGTVIRIRFRLPAVPEDIDADVRVCWTDVRYGLGGQFERISEADHAAMETFVERHLPRP